MRIFPAVLIFSALTLQFSANAEELLESDLSRGQLFSKYILSQAPGGGQILSLDRDFIFPDDVETLAASGRPSVIGVDVSHHNTDGCNCEVDWAVMFDSGVRFVYAKASQGAGADPRLQTYMKGLNALPPAKKLYKGVYHFMSADGSGEDQAEFFVANLDRKLASVGAKRQPDDLPPVLDLEWDHRVNRRGKPIPCSDGQVHADCWATVSPDEIVARVGAWLKRVKELTGREPLVYTSNEWVKGRLRDGQFAKLNAKLWVAQYLKHDKTGKRTLLTVSPSAPPHAQAPVWQFSDRAQPPDESNLSGVDASIYKGTLEDFKTAMQLPK